MMIAQMIKGLIRFARKHPYVAARPLARVLGVGTLTLLSALMPSSAAYAAETVTRTNTAPRPNIVFILADDMGYGDAGFMGQRWIKTPNIDRLAEEGMILTHHYAGAPMCAPARCSLMTGMHNGHNTITDNLPSHYTLRIEDITVAEILKDAGYATHFIGKWGLGGATPTPDRDGTGHLIPEAAFGLPTRKGFDTSYAFLCQITAHQYFPQYMWRGEMKEILPGNYDKPYEERTDYVQDHFTDEALSHIDNANGEEPFYVQLSYIIPHRETKFPYSPRLAHEPDPNAWNPYEDVTWEGMEEPPPPVSQAYAAMITHMDRDVGRIVEAVDRNPAIADNTLIIFTSDNGPQFTDGHQAEVFDSSGGLREKKFFLYEGGIRVPFAARWPGVIEPGRSSEHASYFADFLPTAAELAGAPTPEGLDGVSMVPTLMGQPDEQTDHDYMIWTQPNVADRPTEAIRKRKTGDGRIWKLLRHADGAVELYDLAADPAETADLSQEVAYTALVAELIETLDQQTTGSKPAAPPVVEIRGDVIPAPDIAHERRYILDFGTIAQGSAPITKVFKVHNAAEGYAHRLEGHVQAHGISDDRLNIMDGEFGRLIGGAMSQEFAITLTPDSSGELADQRISVADYVSGYGSPASDKPLYIQIVGTIE